MADAPANTTNPPQVFQLSPEVTAQLLNPSITRQQISSLVPIKLTTSNYVLWRSLLTPILQQYHMFGIAIGTEPCPATFLPDSTNINPDYTEWLKRDRTCRIWLTATLSDAVLPFHVGSTTAHSLWVTLERRLAATTRSHVLQIRRRLQTLQKGTQSMQSYLQQLKELADSLAHAGEPLADADLVAHTLHGLPPDYDSFATSIRVCAEPILSEELHGFLLSEEVELQCRNDTLVSHLNSNPPQAFVAFNHPLHPTRPTNPNFTRPRRPNTNFIPNRSLQPRQPNNHSRPFFRYPSQAPRTLGNLSGIHTCCQICGRNNHTAITCFQRMNYAFQGCSPPARIQANLVGSPASFPAPSSSVSTWYADSGATNHITNDLSNLSIHSDYQGLDTVSTANGDQLPIAHVGSSTASPTNLGSSITSGYYIEESSVSRPY